MEQASLAQEIPCRGAIWRTWVLRFFSALIFCLSPGWAAASADKLSEGFLDPPASARPLVFWQWMNGCITQAGITSDLESFKRVGLAGIQNFQVGGSEAAPLNPEISVLSPEWREMMRFAEAECDRLGLEFGTHNCPGWSSSGGPWVEPANSMQKLVWTETPCQGGFEFSGSLPRPAIDPRWNYYEDVAVLAYPATPQFRESQVIDLTSRMGPTGQIAWNPPVGKWLLARFGHTTTGQINGTAPDSGQGLECDKMSRRAVDLFWKGYPEKLVSDARGNRSFRRLEIDSYEAGAQNWTPAMCTEFQRRRGYDPLPWLPALAGRVLNDPETNRRFLFDWAQTISNLFSENYYDYLAERCSQVPGLELMIEPYATGKVEPFDGPEASDGNDQLACEFWAKPCTWGWDSVKPVVSSAHVDGKTVVYGESFTGQPQYAWRADPYALKSTGDRAFCEGVNRLILHASPLQPWPAQRPGMTMGWWGTQFGPGQTWWEHGGPAWIDYLARCQFLLQQGSSVGDILYLCKGRTTPAVPVGYAGDTCGEREFLTRLHVEDGALVTAQGARYRLLVVPDTDAMLPEVLIQLARMVKEGVTVVGPRPSRSPSLQDFPSADSRVASLGSEVWGAGGENAAEPHRFGRGRVFQGQSAEQVLAELRLEPDILQSSDSHLLWIHRRTEDADIYFIANPLETLSASNVSFRITGRQPELWHPDTGGNERATAGWTEGDRTSIPLRLDPCGSVFVIFRRTPTAGLSPARDESEAAAGPATMVGGPWTLSFPAGWGAPAQIQLDRLLSWSDSADPGVRYFSGTARYRTSFTLPSGFVRPHRRIILDLGRVRNIAEVRLNGRLLGALWKPPFSLDVEECLRTGDNILDVDVTNLWPNRLIGDEQEPDDCEWGPEKTFGYVDPPVVVGRRLLHAPAWLERGGPRPSAGRYTFTTFKFFQKDSPLMESGLLGPVTLRASDDGSRLVSGNAAKLGTFK